MPIADLDELLAGLTVHRRPGTWCMVSGVAIPDGVTVAATVVEEEGTTSVLATVDAERLGVHPEFVAAWLTLDVESALGAVGLTAVVSAALAAVQIPCNVIAGFHHDHLLVPVARAGQALDVLNALSSPTLPASRKP